MRKVIGGTHTPEDEKIDTPTLILVGSDDKSAQVEDVQGDSEKNQAVDNETEDDEGSGTWRCVWVSPKGCGMGGAVSGGGATRCFHFL